MRTLNHKKTKSTEKKIIQNTHSNRNYPKFTGKNYSKRLLTPGLRQQFPDRGGSHLREERPPVDTPEVRDVAEEIQLISDHSQTRRLKGKVYYNQIYIKQACSSSTTFQSIT